MPYSYAKQKFDIRIGHDVIEIFHKGLRICSHKRLNGKLRQYPTCIEHMPENHKSYISMNKEIALKWAMDKGENVQLLVERIFGRVTVEQQSYRSIVGLM